MKKTLLTLAAIMLNYYSYAQTNTFPSNGNVGIGTTSPTEKLVIDGGNLIIGTDGGNQYIKAPYAGGAIQIRTSSSTIDRGIALGLIANDHTSFYPYLTAIDGNVGIGTEAPNTKLQVAGTLSAINLTSSLGSSTPVIYGNIGSAYPTWGISMNHVVENGNTNTYGMALLTTDSYLTGRTEKIRIAGNGNVGIGISMPDSKLTVNGTVHAKEVKVDLTGWPDYVFTRDYKLLSIKELKNYIDQNGRLPEMPSEQEVTKNGINLGEIVKLQMQKIEELTLYAIDQDKRIAALEKTLAKLMENKEK